MNFSGPHFGFDYNEFAEAVTQASGRVQSSLLRDWLKALHQRVLVGDAELRELRLVFDLVQEGELAEAEALTKLVYLLRRQAKQTKFDF